MHLLIENTFLCLDTYNVIHHTLQALVKVLVEIIRKPKNKKKVEKKKKIKQLRPNQILTCTIQSGNPNKSF